MILTPARRKLADAVAASLFTDSGAFLAAADLLGRCGLVSRRQRTKTGAEGDPSTAQERASVPMLKVERAVMDELSRLTLRVRIQTIRNART